MRQELMEILACPLCKGPLELRADERDGERIVTGRLRCDPCGSDYPVRSGIPNLLPPHLRSEG